MRNAALAIGLGLVLVFAVSGLEFRQSRLFAQFPSPAPTDQSTSGGLIALSSDSAENQQVTVIDPQSRVMSVYHVDHASGTISLKSVRNIHADLLMDEYNTERPLPREIRAILTQR